MQNVTESELAALFIMACDGAEVIECKIILDRCGISLGAEQGGEGGQLLLFFVLLFSHVQLCSGACYWLEGWGRWFDRY